MNRKLILPLFLLVQLIGLRILSLFPETVERFYSNGFYPILSKISRITLGNISFSVGDVIYGIALFFLLKWFWKQRKTWKSEWKSNFLTLIGYVSIFYFLFNVLWALNYLRIPMYQKLNIEREYSQKDLLLFTKQLIVKTNALHSQLAKNDSVKIVIPYTQEQIFEKAQNGYDELAKIYPYLTYRDHSVKPSLISLPLTYMGFGGYLNPFTNEAQVNDRVPKHNFVVTTAHEMSHQIGIGSESEANFVGFMATIYNDDLYFNYCGYSYALRYCLGNMENFQEGSTKELISEIHPGILKDFEETQQFWDSHQTFIDVVFHSFYDKFLKINQQKDGLESYSKFVDLMVNYYKTKKL
ncbi:DUF3810 domain-containing protein [Flavobacterium sp. SM15]|uniref:DUF3810 domain-containing protein n=1 Tax=Flavobacterium sp. SM15 TaxID=2908005 RepID=UPI001ED9EE46|nr:DUF3810 domain-containing protein [Flavobacterium sp. SM15]MCG2612546.1 DUF3810 domain-containing protein [Flavobacterium sp. SM15]